MRSIWTLGMLVLAVLGAAGCDGGGKLGSLSRSSTQIRILSGSENKSLEPLIQRYERQSGNDAEITYLGSVDTMLELERGATAYDAVWPAHSLWVDLGDRSRLVKHSTSIMRSPVVFGVKKSVATRLGWVGKDVTVEQILKAAESGRLRFMLTSATQSNSGASAYLGYLYAFAGAPEVLTTAHLRKPQTRERIRRLLGAVNRSAGSSGWLKDLFLEKYDQYDAMVNYEALVIEANQALAAKNREPLYAVYPVDGLAMADSPLGYVNHGDAAKEQAFLKLQQFLLSPEVQREITATGRRVGLAGLDATTVDRRLFNPEWGIDAARVLNPIRFPQAEVIREALDLYQTSLRKPSFTIYCLDFSGSMRGRGIEDLKSSMRLMLSQEQARRYLLQTSNEDVTVVIPFSSRPMQEWRVDGNDPEKLNGLMAQIDQLPPDGGTDIYSPAIQALATFKRERNLEKYFPAVILMTDGRSNQGASMAQLRAAIASARLDADVPVFPIMFGEASQDQLGEVARETSGRVFDGRKDLIQAFRDARGYN